MDSEDWMIVAVAAIVAYLWWSKSSQWSDATGRQALTNAGFTAAQSEYTPTTQLFMQGNTTYGFAPGDFEKLNMAQRTLITLDKIVPGSFLTRWALT